MERLNGRKRRRERWKDRQDNNDRGVRRIMTMETDRETERHNKEKE